MIKISRLADYAVVILATMSKTPAELMTAAALSARTSLPEPTVAKVLKLLSKDGLLASVRGASGGYKLSRTADELSVASIVMAVDGPIALTACVEGHNSGECGYQKCCPVKGRWDHVNSAILSALTNVTLADMAQENKGAKAA